MLRVKELPQFRDYINYVRRAVFACFLVILVCGIGFFISETITAFNYCLIWLSITMIAACYRSTSQFFLLMKCNHEETVSRAKYYGTGKKTL